jgi:carbamoyl-phosphate synthase large subunit
MENFDPMGIHTGESIVIAPSQTLSNTDCQIMRDIALKTIRHLGIIGECNIQFAYDPYSRKCRVIEVNARLSRSSALASKVTGYPLAYVAAKIALGYTLDEIKNSVTQVTTAFFEPSLDYVVCKIPRWDLDKFSRVDNKIGSEMKSVGEVMSIGRSIEEVIQKALRNLDIGALGLVGNPDDFDYNETDIDIATPKRIFAIARAFIFGHNVEYIHKKTSIDPFFLEKIKSVVETFIEIRNTENILSEKNIHLIKKAKKQGFSDLQIAIATNSTEAQIRKFRTQNLITPVVKKIDTLAGEFPSVTNYLYTTYHGTKSDSIKDENRKKIIILGSGSYRIGCSVEFDWCSVSTLKTLKELGYDTIIVNYNPETVSTDFDSSDRLYFDEISLERVLDIYETEKPIGVIVSMGGQIANNLALKLENAGVHVL